MTAFVDSRPHELSWPLGDAVEQAKENLRITEEQYKEQVATQTDVLVAQTINNPSVIRIQPPLIITRAEAENLRETVYIVKPGDTLSEIAERHGVSLADVRAKLGIAPKQARRPRRKTAARKPARR